MAKVKVGIGPNGLAYDAGHRLLLAANVGDPARPGSFTVSLVDVGTASPDRQHPGVGADPVERLRRRERAILRQHRRSAADRRDRQRRPDAARRCVFDAGDGSAWARPRSGHTASLLRVRRPGAARGRFAVGRRAERARDQRRAGRRLPQRRAPSISTSRSAIPESSTSSTRRRCAVSRAFRPSAARTRSASTRPATSCTPSCRRRIGPQCSGDRP